ncbi:MAG: type II 3-dehydroquinate dehydratase [Rhodospirillales bacterium]
MKLLLIQGANMEYLGKRQPELYGTTTAAELEEILQREAAGRGLSLEIRTSNLEGEAITWIYRAERAGCQGLIMNPAGFLYAGYALRDCLKAIGLPYVEVHMTNLERRGMHSVTASEADGMITGLGIDSYILALDAMQRLLQRST